jgi:hypothetical protein
VAASFHHDSGIEFTVDGVLVGTLTATSPVGLATSGLVVGAGSGDTFGGFKGAIKDVFVYDASLSTAEIRFLMTETVMPPPAVVAGRWGYAFSPTSDRQQAFVAVDVSDAAQSPRAKTLAMWMAPTRGVPGDFCICQLATAGEQEVVTVWAYYSPAQATNFLRVGREKLGETATERLFPSVILPADGKWHHVVITWNASRIAMTVDGTLSVRLLLAYSRASSLQD